MNVKYYDGKPVRDQIFRLVKTFVCKVTGSRGNSMNIFAYYALSVKLGEEMQASTPSTKKQWELAVRTRAGYFLENYDTSTLKVTQIPKEYFILYLLILLHLKPIM